ncbi:MAG TPA: thiamine-phosphate kinase [Halothiobacillus sp.]|nr:thiamine-phosphate kinase [Halothiobacillus sp.]
MNEFELIATYFVRPCQRNDVLQSIGDDCAELKVPKGEHLLVTSDTLIAGRHFLTEAEAANVGHKALAVNLSDLAAMGATARWVTLALSMPMADERWLASFAEGFFALAAQHGVCLIGGDTTRGPMSITVTAMGTVPAGQSLRRSGAKPGDWIAVTGTIGDAGYGLALAMGEKMAADPTAATFLKSRLDRPTPRLAEGQLLRGRASASIDISDGLAQDLGHILKQSGVGAQVDLAKLPLSDALITECGPIDAWGDEEWTRLLAAGDDYELLFTFAPKFESQLREQLDFTVIGRIRAEPGLRLIAPDGRPFIPEYAGYDHFASS